MVCRLEALEQKYYDTLHEVLNNRDSLPRSPRTCEGVAEDVRTREASEEYSGMNVLKILVKHLLMKHRAQRRSQSQHMKCNATFLFPPDEVPPLSQHGKSARLKRESLKESLARSACSMQ